MLYHSPPEGFSPKFEISLCCCDYSRKILFLQRQDGKPQSGTYGMPAGKCEPGELPADTMKRELEQETGIFAVDGQLVYFMTVYVRYPGYDFVSHMFYAKFDNEPSVIINSNEHKAYRWSSPEEALKMNLIPDADETIRLFYKL